MALSDSGSGGSGTNRPGLPTGTATPGPGHGEITLNFMPATSGPAPVAFNFRATASGETTITSTLVAAARTTKFTGLDVTKTWTVGVRASLGIGNSTSNFATASLKPKDTTAPAVTGAAVNGAALTLTFHKDLDAAPNLANSAFTVKVGGSAVFLSTTTGPSISGRTVTLALAGAVASTDTVTVSYTRPTSGTGNALKDSVGKVASFTDRAVTNNTPRPPFALESASVDGATLRLVLSVILDEDSVPAKGSFSVSLAGAAQTPTGVSFDGKTVTLTLATAAARGQAALVTYTKPGTKPLRDVYGRELAGFARTAINVADGVASAEAGEDREVLTGASVTLSGSGSSTRSNPTYSYRWTQTAGVSVTLSGANTATPSLTAPSVRTDLEFSLVVNDGVADSLADTVTVRVRPPPHPTSAPCVHPARRGRHSGVAPCSTA